MDRYGFLKTAAAIPSVRVADCAYNGERIAALVAEAAGRGVEVVLFPELSVTGYTCGDLFLQPALAALLPNRPLRSCCGVPAELNTAFVVGLPVAVDDMLYNCAVVAAAGEVLGVVPKCHIPDYAEFYESRWFASGQGRPTVEIELCGQSVPFGPDLLFDIGGARCAVEICEDLWVPAPPSAEAATAGAEVILNLSASPETVGKSDYVRQLVVQQSARTRAAYLYCSAGFGESSTDLVFAGHGAGGRERRGAGRVGAFLARRAARRGRRRLPAAAQRPLPHDDVPPQRRGRPYHGRRDDARGRRPSVRPHGRGDALRTGGGRPAAQPLRGDSQHSGDGIGAPAGAYAEHEGCRRHFGRTGFDARTARDGACVRPAGTRPAGDRGDHDARFRDDRPHLRQCPDRPDARTGRHGARNIRSAPPANSISADIGLDREERPLDDLRECAGARTDADSDGRGQPRSVRMVVGTGDLSRTGSGLGDLQRRPDVDVRSSTPRYPRRSCAISSSGMLRTCARRMRCARCLLRRGRHARLSPNCCRPMQRAVSHRRPKSWSAPTSCTTSSSTASSSSGYSPAKILFLAERAFGRTLRPGDDPAVDEDLFLRAFSRSSSNVRRCPTGRRWVSVALSPRGDWRMPSDASAAVWLAEIDRLEKE